MSRSRSRRVRSRFASAGPTGLSLLAALAIAATLSGCDRTIDVDDTRAGTPFVLAASRGCLGELGVFSGELGSTAEHVDQGALRLSVAGKDVALIFGRDAANAETLARSYKETRHVVNARRANNVAVLWMDSPSDAEIDAVETCLATAAQLRAEKTRKIRAEARRKAEIRALDQKIKSEKRKDRVRAAKAAAAEAAPSQSYHSEAMTCDLPDGVDRIECVPTTRPTTSGHI